MILQESQRCPLYWCDRDLWPATGSSGTDWRSVKCRTEGLHPGTRDPGQSERTSLHNRCQTQVPRSQWNWRLCQVNSIVNTPKWVCTALFPGPTVMSTLIAIFMGLTWGPPGSCRPQVGPMLATWTLLFGYQFVNLTNGFTSSWRVCSCYCEKPQAYKSAKFG